MTDHPPYSPHLVLSGFQLFVPIMKHLAGRRFVIDADVKQAATSSLCTFDIDLFYTAHKYYVGQMLKCQR